MFILSNTPTYSPPTLLERAATFRQVYPDLAKRCNGRIERALEIAAGPLSIIATGPDNYSVQSQSNKLGTYTINTANHTCTCPDHGAHKGIICKHRLAVGLYYGFEIMPEHTVDQPDLTLPTLQQLLSDAQHDAASLWYAIEAKEENFYNSKDATLYNGMVNRVLALQDKIDELTHTYTYGKQRPIHKIYSHPYAPFEI